jgi:hypothetical protein
MQSSAVDVRMQRFMAHPGGREPRVSHFGCELLSCCYLPKRWYYLAAEEEKRSQKKRKAGLRTVKSSTRLTRKPR